VGFRSIVGQDGGSRDGNGNEQGENVFHIR
jgi:hypothetical protein